MKPWNGSSSPHPSLATLLEAVHKDKVYTQQYTFPLLTWYTRHENYSECGFTTCIQKQHWAGERAPWVKVLATKSDELSSIPNRLYLKDKKTTTLAETKRLFGQNSSLVLGLERWSALTAPA